MKGNVRKAPSFIEPMKALPVEELPEGDWLYEINFDGFRALAFKDRTDVHLVSRNNKAFDYPLLLDALKKLPTDRVVLDGEIPNRVTRQSLQKTPSTALSVGVRKRPTRLAPKKISIARLPITGSDVFGREEDLAFLDRVWANKDINVVTFIAFREFRQTPARNYRRRSCTARSVLLSWSRSPKIES